MLPEIKERLKAIYAADNLKNYNLRDKKQKWYQLIVIYINYILKYNIISASKRFVDAFIEQYPLIGIKLLSKTDAIDYIIDVPKLLASDHYYEPRATNTIGFAVDRYDIPILTMDASLNCSDTASMFLSDFNTHPNFTVHCEIISPITVYDESATDAIYLLIEGIRNKCFQPNGSTGFHINTSIWSKSRGIQIGLSDQFLCNSFLDKYLPYEAENYETLRESGIHIIEKINPYSFKTQRKVTPDYYARPLAKEAKDRFFHTYYASILRTTENKPVKIGAFAEKYYKVFSNLNKRNSSRTDKYIAVLHKGGGLLEFRLFPSVTDFNSLRTYIHDTITILRTAYIDYIEQHLAICAELNALASEVYVRNISEVNVAPFYNLYDEVKLDELSVWNPLVLLSRERIPYNNANIITYDNRDELEYIESLDKTRIINDYLMAIFFYQHAMHQLTIMDPFGVHEEHLYTYALYKSELYVMQPANKESIYLVTYELKYSKKMETALATITLLPSSALNN